jgi:putative ABC transport system permease protein
VKHVANGSTLGTETFNMLTYQLEGSSDIYDNATQLYVDAEALSAYGLVTSLSELPTGRFTLVNRTAAETFAKVKGVTTNEIIGLTIITEPEYLNPETGNMGIPFQIAGIFEDIHLFSLHEKVQPYFLTVSKNVRMDGRTIIAAEKSIDGDLLSKIQTEYTKLGETVPLELEFLDENVKNLYEQDRQFGQLLFYLNIIAIVLSGVGLIGITIFTLKMKVKEIGIRKVLGARVIEIVKMMSAGYLFLVSLSLVIAWPLAYFLTQAWLQEFAYRVEMAQWVFPLIGLFTLIFTIALVAIISGKAALTNPVESIRNE